jgi:hypothetical protein
MIVGATLSTVLSAYQDRVLARYLASSAKSIENSGRIRRAIDMSSPEGRLYFACIESALLPIGLFCMYFGGEPASIPGSLAIFFWKSFTPKHALPSNC